LAVVSTSDTHELAGTHAGLEFRTATVADARLYAELSLAHRPDEPGDPEVTRHGWAHPTPGYTRERYMIELGGRAAGYTWHFEGPLDADPDRNGEVSAFLAPWSMSAERLRGAFEFIEERSAAAGVRTFTADVWEDDAGEVEVLESLGYRRDRLSKAWELDLIEHRDRLLLLTDRAEAMMREQGITCVAIAADADPTIWTRCHEVQAAAGEDMPRTGPYHRPTYEQYMSWMETPDVSPFWCFAAKDGERVVGFSNLRFPPVQGNVWTGFTGVIREYRGRGIARAVKLAILKQAIEQNVARVRTDNDEANEAMLHINEELGYQRIPGVLSYRKRS